MVRKNIQGGAYKDGSENIFFAKLDGPENFGLIGRARQNKKDQSGRATHISGPSL